MPETWPHDSGHLLPAQTVQRRVVLICGPPGAGKSTLARSLSLTVYDRDETQWSSEQHFAEAIAGIGRDPRAQAAVIRTGATRTARGRAAQLVVPTETILLTTPLDQCHQAILGRGARPGVSVRTQLAAATAWWARFEPGPPTAPRGGRSKNPTGDPALKTPARRALRAAVRTNSIATGRGCELPACVLPTRTIDWSARWPHPAAYVLDEIHPRWLGGSPTDPTNVRPGHVRCNSVAGVAITNAKRKASRTLVTPSRITLALDNW